MGVGIKISKKILSLNFDLVFIMIKKNSTNSCVLFTVKEVQEDTDYTTECVSSVNYSSIQLNLDEVKVL